MKQKRVYISGAISNIKRHGYMKRFADVEQMLKAQGFAAVNPTHFLPCRWPWVYSALEWLLGKTNAYRVVMAYDLWRLRKCDAIYVMWGSDGSRGSRLERRKAREWGIPEMNYTQKEPAWIRNARFDILDYIQQRIKKKLW